MLERPITSASSPSSDGRTELASFIQAIGVHGTSVGNFAAKRPKLIG